MAPLDRPPDDDLSAAAEPEAEDDGLAVGWIGVGVMMDSVPAELELDEALAVSFVVIVVGSVGVAAVVARGSRSARGRWQGARHAGRPQNHYALGAAALVVGAAEEGEGSFDAGTPELGTDVVGGAAEVVGAAVVGAAALVVGAGGVVVGAAAVVVTAGADVVGVSDTATPLPPPEDCARSPLPDCDSVMWSWRR